MMLEMKEQQARLR